MRLNVQVVIDGTIDVDDPEDVNEAFESAEFLYGELRAKNPELISELLDTGRVSVTSILPDTRV